MGPLQFLTTMLKNYFPPAPTYDPARDMPDLSGKVIIVTGGNTGIGKETVRALLRKNAKVYMASRSREKAEAAIRELKQETGNEAIFLELDLASLDKTTKAANEFKSKEAALHVLINQGGVMSPPIDHITEDGYDLQFGTNVLGHAHLTLCLLPELAAGAKTSPDGHARVVNTSSFAAYLLGPEKIQWDTLKDGPKRKALGDQPLYWQSKYANIAFSNELARRVADRGITSNAVNPGNIDSDLYRHMPRIILKILQWTLLYPASRGALTQLYVATSPETKDASGKWFIPWAREVPHDSATRDPEVKARLWDWIEEQRKEHC